MRLKSALATGILTLAPFTVAVGQDEQQWIVLGNDAAASFATALANAEVQSPDQVPGFRPVRSLGDRTSRPDWMLNSKAYCNGHSTTNAICAAAIRFTHRSLLPWLRPKTPSSRTHTWLARSLRRLRSISKCMLSPLWTLSMLNTS